MRKKKKKQKKYYEAKGLLFLGLFVFFTISLISFINGQPEQNYLGIIGYSIAWITISAFGLGSYLISCYIFYIGWRFLSKNPIENIKLKTSFFLIFLSSSCILLTVFSNTYPHKIAFLGKKIFTDSIFLTTPYPQMHTRYNLGGIPFFYIYHDIPFINLQKLLSSIGTVLIFSTGWLVSFILLSEEKIIPKIKSFPNIFKKIFSLLKKIPAKKEVFEYIPPKPIIHENTFPEKKIERKKPIFQKPPSIKNCDSYNTPPQFLLSNPEVLDAPFLKKELKKQKDILEATLKNFGIQARVGDIHSGPTITSFEVHPAIGVKVQKIKTLENDIALNLQAKSIRIIAPIPGKAAVGVEVPSLHPQTVTLKEMLNYYEQTKKKHNIPLLLGKTVSGDHVITDLAKMPHLLVAGATGSGKSVCINTIVMSILMNRSPDEVKFIMIDPKKVELTQYSKLPHMIAPVVTEAHGAYGALQWLVREMKFRYEILKQLGLRNITAFNHRKIKKELEKSLSIDIPEKFPFMIAIIDEFADLMMVSSSDLETPIARIAQMARAVGIHLILATQRPSREVITGIIKANFPSRIAFKVASRINSQIILDETGAETLLGNGDFLFLPPGSSHLIRAQGAYISDEDINNVIEHMSKKHPPSYLVKSFDTYQQTFQTNDDPKDKLYTQALTLVLNSKNASTTFLQRKLKIGYARAASLIDELEENNIVGPQDGSRPRRILKDQSFLESLNG